MSQVSVVKKNKTLSLKINNSYYLGGTGTFLAEKLQTHIPFAIKSSSDNVYLLGLGTGITAGEVLNFSKKELLVAELNPLVIEASESYFGPYINGLYQSKNARVVADDGRTVLYGYPKSFDVIIADLFVTWNKGVGSLYSEEHFTKAKGKLSSTGIYVQWLPFYNFFREEFWSVVKTMKKVFPRVTMWQLMLHPDHIVVGLIGHKDKKILNKEDLLKNLLTHKNINRENVEGHYYRLLSYFVADLSQCSEVTKEFPLNTEDFPFIEFHSPKSAITTTDTGKTFLLGQNFLNLHKEINNKCHNLYNYINNLPQVGKDIASAGINKLIYNIKKKLKVDNTTERNILNDKIGLDRHKLILKAESDF